MQDSGSDSKRFHASWLAALLLAAIAAIAFVRLYATATPLTDEWAFVQSVIDIDGIDDNDPRWLPKAIDAATLRFNGHVVTVPFLLYWLIAPRVHFDHRWFVALTLLTLLAQIGFYRRCFGRATLALVPIAIVMLSPAHYMEFLWGFEFTLALSIVLPMAGLAVLARIDAPDTWGRRGAKLAGGLALIALGACSSFGGWFGFPAGVLLLALGPLATRAKAVLIAPVVLAGAGILAWMIPEAGTGPPLGPRVVFHLLTALGGTVWSSEVGLFEFGPDLHSATGAVILLAFFAVVLRAARRRALGTIALPLSFAAFGLACLASIAIGREYLGNWHLQYALPAVTGAFACAYLAWRSEPGSARTIAPLAVLSLTLLGSVAGGARAFVKFGPEYRAYIADVEAWARRRLQVIDAEKPVPSAPELGADLLLYLSAVGHPLFADSAQSRVASESTGSERVFVENRELARPAFVVGPNRERVRLTVVLPSSEPALGVWVDAGGARLRLHRIDPRHGSLPTDVEGAFFAGWMLPGRLAEGPQPVRVWLSE